MNKIKTKLTDFHRIVIMNTLAGIGMGLTGIFIPIYLLHLDFSLSATISYLIAHHISIMIGSFLVVFVSNRIGLIGCWYIRIILVSTLFVGLWLLPEYRNLIFILPILNGLESAFFWIPYNVLTIRKTSKESMGASLAFMSNVGSITGLFVPLIASFIITSLGYPILFVTALFFLLISLIPVLTLKHEKTEFNFNLVEIKKTIRENRHFILPEIFDNLSQDAGIIWTLFIFIMGLTVLDIGFLGLVSGIVGIFVTYITGRLIDKWNVHKVVRFGAIFATLSWLASYFIAVYIPTPIMLYVITALRGLAIGIFAMSYGTIMFNRARNADAQFIVLREIPTIFGRVIIFSISLFFVYIGHLEFAFIIVTVLSLYFWFNNLRNLSR